MIPELLSFQYLLEAKEFYASKGWTYIETPWVASAEAMNITRPAYVPVLTQPAFVASGEQSFLDLIVNRSLKPGKWQTLTPCYRSQDGDADDGLHFSQFYKLELMWYKSQSEPHPEDPIRVIQDVAEFMYRWDWEPIVKTVTDEPRAECETWLAYDLEYDWTELGSYGNRFHKEIGYWVYGTGLAEPRFSDVIRRNKIEKRNVPQITT
jgi:hypothetical protein